MHKFFAYAFPFWLFCYSVFSFSQTDPNLVLSSHPWFWQFQQQMWQFGFHNRPALTAIFITLMLLLFVGYREIVRGGFARSQLVGLFVASLIALLPSYPALSHDIYNYLFNAKMVITYHANPHIQVALDFPNDPWLKFMHNVHTPAPYGYGWTIVSLIPYLLGGGYLQGELLIFRFMMIAALITCLWLITKIEEVSLERLALLAFNPLILIEMIGNIHNDLIMMVPALMGLLLFRKAMNQKKWFWGLAGLLCLSFSISIKYASVALVGAILASIALPQLSIFQWSVLSMWSPLLTSQSQRFLPWYLTWSLVFIPFIKQRFWVRTMVITTMAGLLSYGFILWNGEYSPLLLQQRSLFLFGMPLVFSFGQLVLRKRA